jgi:hypothetical protein
VARCSARYLSRRMGRRSTRQEASRARSRCSRGTGSTRRRSSAARDPNCAEGAGCASSAPERSDPCRRPDRRRARPERSNNSRGNSEPGAGGRARACPGAQERSGSEARSYVELSSCCKAGSRACARTARRACNSAECHRHDASTEGCAPQSGSCCTCCRSTLHGAITGSFGSSVHRHGTRPNPCCAPASRGCRASCDTGCGTCGTYRARSSRCPSRTACKGNSSRPSARCSRAGSCRESARRTRLRTSDR